MSGTYQLLLITAALTGAKKVDFHEIHLNPHAQLLGPVVLRGFISSLGLSVEAVSRC